MGKEEGGGGRGGGYFSSSTLRDRHALFHALYIHTTSRENTISTTLLYRDQLSLSLSLSSFPRLLVLESLTNKCGGAKNS